MIDDSCPPTNQLAAMMTGAIAPEHLDQLILHVDTCDSCQRRVEQIELSDPLAQDLANLRNIESSEHSAGYLDRLANCSSSRSRKDPFELPVEIGPYQLTRVLAVGGMGTVYEAHHRRLGRPFAFKLLHSGVCLSRSQAQRVHREWRTHGSLVHPNIVSATDAGIADGLPYLVTEFVLGSDLAQVVKQFGPLAPSDACELIRQAAVGLSYAHSQQVIHRDVKPSNLMLDSLGTVKVLDLGTASWRNKDDTEITDPGIFGTLAYMAPERFSDRCTQQSDVYSLGCTLYCLLTGTPPCGRPQDSSNQAIMEAHRSASPRPLQERVADETRIDPQLQWIVDRMLAKDPVDRLESMQALISQIEPLCHQHDLPTLVDRLRVDSPRAWERSEQHNATLGLTSLFTVPATRRRWMIPTAIVLILAAILAFASSRFPTALVTENDTAFAPERTNPITRTARTSLGDDLRHRSGPPWQSAPRRGTIDGLVLQPAKFPGIDHWQIETAAPRGRVRCLRWSADGRQVATVSSDGHLRVFDWRDHQLSLTQIISHRDHHFLAVDFHPSQPVLYACTDEKLLRIDIVSGQIRSELNFADARDLKIVPGQSYVSVSAPGGLFLFDTKTFELATKIDGNIQPFAWSPDGQSIVYADGKTIAVRRLVDGVFSKRTTVHRVIESQPVDLAWVPSKNQFAMLHANRVTILDSRNLAHVLDITTNNRAESISIGGSDDKLVVGSEHGIQWLSSTKLASEQNRHQRNGRSKVAWNPRQNCIAIGQNGLLRIVDQQIQPLDQIGGVKSVRDVVTQDNGDVCVLFRSGKLVTANRDGRMLGWSTFLPDGKQIAESLQMSVKPQHVAAVVYPQGPTLIDVRIPWSHHENAGDAPSAPNLPLLRFGYWNGKYRVKLFDREMESWRSIWVSDDHVKAVHVSPNGDRIAILFARRQLSIVSVPEGNILSHRSFDQLHLQNVCTWIDHDSLLIAGAMNRKSRMAACYDVDSQKLRWMIDEEHNSTAAEVILLDAQSFLQAGAVHHVRSTIDGTVLRSFDVQQKYGRRHDRLFRADMSDRYFSWGYDYRSDLSSNSSDGLVCWDAKERIPLWSMIDVGEEESLTLSPAGKILSATQHATEGLRWMVQTGQGRRLLSHDQFHQPIREPKRDHSF